jgi:hypothetical protein
VGGSLGVFYAKISVNESVSIAHDTYQDNSCIAGQQGNAIGGAVGLWYGQDLIGASVMVDSIKCMSNTVSAQYSALGGCVGVMNDGQSLDLVSSIVIPSST